ncbi:MAG: glycosyltransferase [Longimicrobiaceae bacterium]
MKQRKHAPPVVPPAVAPLRRRPANAVPQLSPRQERLIRLLAVVTLAYWTYYIAWRWGHTLNWSAPWFSIPLVLAETWGLVTGFIMVHSVWRIRHRQPLPAPPGLSVDVFITCYDEPLEVIRRTAIGARAIRYPHQTWILDDGKRDEVKALAEELRVGYLRRPTNEHAKAGNLNHALAHTRGDFILQLDADHVPLPQILDRVLGFFAEDPKLAFVQTPQDFYNTDAFTYKVNEASQRIWEEQRLFFGVIQPGKDSINGTFFCGCSAVIRRAALESIGGFSTHSITEDIETSLKLHGAGWNSAFYGESLVYGLAAHSAVAFHTQHLRWGQGAMQVLKRYNPLTFPGLTLHQRISYFGSLTAYVGGVQKLVFFAAPLLFFFTGVLPVRALNADFMLHFVPFLLLSFALSEAQARGRTNTWAAERFHMVKFWTYTRAVFSIFSRRPRRFNVTPKGAGHVPFRIYAPHVVLMALTLLAVVWATVASATGWIEYPGYGWGSLAFISNGFWAAVNFALAAAVVRMSRRIRQQRADHRFRGSFPVGVRIAREGGRITRAHVALAQDLNPGGMSFRSTRPLEPGTELRLTLQLSTATVNVKGSVLRCESMGGAGEPLTHRIGVAFHDVPMNVRDQIELHCTQHAVPLEQSLYRFAGAGMSLLEKPVNWVLSTRHGKRRRVNLPARITVGSARQGGRRREQVALLEEVSEGGARLMTDTPFAPGTMIEYQVPGTVIRGRGRVVFARALETPLGVSFAVGIARQPAPAAGAGGRTRREPAEAVA